MPRGAANCLNQGAIASQETLLIGIEDRDQGHLWHIETLAQQVDAYQHIEVPKSKVANNLHPLDGVDIRVQVTHAHLVIIQKLSQILRHALSQCGDQHSVACLYRGMNLSQQIIHLGTRGADLHHRVYQAGGAHYLLYRLACVIVLIGPGRGGHINSLRA